MELGPLFIGIAAVAAMIVPVMYVHKAQKNKEIKFLQHFLDLAKAQGINPTQHELWNINYIIGLDETSKKVFYLKKNGVEEKTMTINLAEVEKCRIANKTHTIKSSGGNSNVIDRIDLMFINRNPQKADKSIEFYNGEESMSLRGEVPLTDKWCNIINSTLKSNKK
jgi:hypothetical protein